MSATISEYIAKQPKPVQPVLRKVRGVIKKALPRATERISYQIPMYAVDGKMVIYFAGWKKHFAVYPLSRAVIAELGDELSPYKSGVASLNVPYTAPFPAKLITRIVKLRAKEVAAGKKRSG